MAKGRKQVGKLKRKAYEKELRKLQVGLCHLQEWVKQKGLRVIIVFEGRDAAGKGGTIKAITERVSPRVFRVVALPAPSDREKTQMYMQRYMQHFPAAGEIVIFDRSWYNRAGVEYVMGFCPRSSTSDSWRSARSIEKIHRRQRHHPHQDLAGGRREGAEAAFQARIDDPLRQWKLSPMDLVLPALVRLFARARPDARKHRYQARAVVHRPLRRQKARAAQLHLAHPVT